jgi:hypothetical protein
VDENLPFGLLRDPNPFDTLENLERRLAELRAMPAFQFKENHIRALENVIAIRKRHSGA